MEEDEGVKYAWQQLHIEESKSFDLDGEDEENCDLALLTRHFKKDATDMQFDRPLPKAGQKYRHFKLGKIVTVIGISRHTETEEVSVVYGYEGTIWNRPLEMFMREVDRRVYPDAKQKYRFELVKGCEERMTNADKIRNMTDEELAEYFYKASVNCNMCCSYSGGRCKSMYITCKDGILEWLEKEVEE